MNNNLSRYLAMTGLALCAACATAQTYPIEFDLSPVTTNVALNTPFTVDIIARATDGSAHPMSSFDLNVQWDQSLFTTNSILTDQGGGSDWITGLNGFSVFFAPTTEGSDGYQLGAGGGPNPLNFANISIPTGGLAVMRMSFKSLGNNGSTGLNLPATTSGPPNNTAFLQYKDAGGTHTVYAVNGGVTDYGINGGTVNVGAAPEPVSISMLAIGALGLLRRAKARR